MLKMLLRSAVWYSHFAVSLIGVLPARNKLNKLKDTMPSVEFSALANKTVQKWAKSQIKWSGAKVDIIGLENIPDCPVVFIGNHQSYFDIGVMLGLIDKPKGFVSKVEMIKAPILSDYMKFINCIFMDRSDIRKSAKAINEGIDAVKRGHSLVIYPEGTRSKSNKMNEWKAGSFKLAVKSKAPIVPVTLYDSFRVLEANGYKFKPHNVKMTIHKPIYTDGMTKEELAELPKIVQDIIQNELNRLENTLA